MIGIDRAELSLKVRRPIDLVPFRFIRSRVAVASFGGLPASSRPRRPCNWGESAAPIATRDSADPSIEASDPNWPRSIFSLAASFSLNEMTFGPRRATRKRRTTSPSSGRVAEIHDPRPACRSSDRLFVCAPVAARDLVHCGRARIRHQCERRAPK